MLRLDTPEGRLFTVYLDEEENSIWLMADNCALLRIDKRTHQISRCSGVDRNYLFELDEHGRVIVK